MENLQSITNTGFGNVVPTFLLKLLSLLQEPEFNKYVSWNEEGTSFIVHDQASFSKHVLPKYFKHNKFASFVRQLNMYGFRKVTTIAHGGLNDLHEAIEFHHPLFLRGEESLLYHIKRKVAPASSKSEDIGQVLDEMHEIKDTQIGISNSLSELKRENEDLWREVVSLRQKHIHQQKVVNHLIKFLVSLVQHHGMGMKRKLPLMIEDGSGSSQPRSKKPNISASPGADNVFYDNTNATSADDGPLITELLSTSSPSPKLPSSYNPAAPSSYNPTNAMPENSDFDINDLIQYGDTADKMVPPGGKDSNNPIPDNSTSFQNPPVEPSAYMNVVQPVTGSSTASHETNTVNSSVPASHLTQSASTDASKRSLAIAPVVEKEYQLKMDDLNSNMDVIQNNLSSIQRRLSNSQHVNLDYDLIQELFNGSIDITPTPNMHEAAYPIPVTVANPTGSELVQYGGTTDPTQDASEGDMDEFLNLLAN